ncbi:biliverdin-producing heme oxygenase [Devosia rhizoryzae]|uniref:Biliverdin-producing heme oxygenase n=1 Tax=Devosia rhizoryzae TaxID=2774137 RepID=A0ABX7C7G7_9HYPH|nr:biliverdin-producing heme oxygenase [Devosia rhizoryzae]QQR40163.1 biliverdin-producing heme oxygenase [Devosia rhizoryzae]
MQESGSSDQSGLRAALRHHTAPTHQELDALVGAFKTAEQYKVFLLSSFRFRLVAEPAASGSSFWAPLPLIGDLCSDLEDLGLAAPPSGSAALQFATASEKLGALYVLEGSALGARLLQRRAEAIGFNARYGARHLAHQTADNGRWKRFLAVLDDPRFDNDAALAAAQRVFEAALAIYAEAAHEHA